MRKGHIKNINTQSQEPLDAGCFDVPMEEISKQTNTSEESQLEEKIKEKNALKRLADILVDSFLEEFNYAKTNTK